MLSGNWLLWPEEWTRALTIFKMWNISLKLRRNNRLCLKFLYSPSYFIDTIKLLLWFNATYSGVVWNKDRDGHNTMYLPIPLSVDYIKPSNETALRWLLLCLSRVTMLAGNGCTLAPRLGNNWFYTMDHMVYISFCLFASQMANSSLCFLSCFCSF